MPSTLVHAGFALLLAAALLEGEYTRRALGIVVLAMVVPEVDTAVGLVMDGAHRTLLHTLVLPVVFAGLLYYDTRWRKRSWLTERVGPQWVFVAWVVLFAHVFAHVLLDFAHLEGINVAYPVVDRFVRLEGELALSSTDGLVQTFVQISTDAGTGATTVDAGQGGTTADTHVASPVQPERDPAPEEPVDRRFPIAFHGWQPYLIVVGLFTLLARRLQGPPPSEERR